jgi:hypothetical protein
MLKRDELTNPASCMSRARDDEMTFVLLGRDPAAPVAIRAWIEERIRLGKNVRGDAQLAEAEACAAAMEASQAQAPQLGTPLSELSGRPGHPGFERFKQIAKSWGYD